ncbi:hypothetical protein [Kitasatospora sp. NPDC004272]
MPPPAAIPAQALRAGAGAAPSAPAPTASPLTAPAPAGTTAEAPARPPTGQLRPAAPQQLGSGLLPFLDRLLDRAMQVLASPALTRQLLVVVWFVVIPLAVLIIVAVLAGLYFLLGRNPYAPLIGLGLLGLTGGGTALAACRRRRSAAGRALAAAAGGPAEPENSAAPGP